MSWIRRHPYAAACALAGLLLIIGAIFVERRTAAQPSSLSVWGSNGAPLLNPASYSPNAILDDMHPNSGTNAQPVYIPPPQGGAAPSEKTVSIDDLLAGITAPASQGITPTSGISGNAYTFIPSGFVVSSTVQVRSEEEQRLYNYGNDAASYIQTYEDANRNAAILLRDQAEDRRSQAKAQTVKTIAAALRRVGENLNSMEEVPAAAKSAHDALAASYIRVGERLEKVPDAESDEAFIAAIEAYNAAADTLVGDYISLVTVFGLNDVSYASDDPGSIFMFSGGGSL